ncbi:MAG TPA: chemotaxis protein CheW [Holophaga sp.]|nr:chemotaxis protein CheW [Holophaga sp.]
MNLAASAIDTRAGDARSLDVSHQYLTFLLAGQSFAIPLADVAEITPNMVLNRLPHMPKGVEGILDLRGAVLPVMNLRVRLGLPDQEAEHFNNIVILDQGGNPTGILVDRVDCVVAAHPDQIILASPLLAGPDGGWVKGFVQIEQASKKGPRIIAILDSRLITTQGMVRHHASAFIHADMGRELDEGLLALIQMAPRREEEDSTKIIPQMEATISHTEEEMSKVMERVESMLGCADVAFKGLVRLKQELQLGRFRGEEATIAEIERIGQQIQDTVFDLLQQLQFQDIARQKLERVLNHVRGLQAVMGKKFRDTGRPK